MQNRPDVVWSYSGVRPLMGRGRRERTEASRDYTLRCQRREKQRPLISVFGGKITTYRKPGGSGYR